MKTAIRLTFNPLDSRKVGPDLILPLLAIQQGADSDDFLLFQYMQLSIGGCYGPDVDIDVYLDIAELSLGMLISIYRSAVGDPQALLHAGDEFLFVTMDDTRQMYGGFVKDENSILAYKFDHARHSINIL